MISIVNTYAWRKPIAHSKQVTSNTISQGKIHNPCILVVFHVGIKANKNPNNIFKSVCPDIKFANSLIAKLKTLEKYEINSIIIKNGNIFIGTPLGTNKLKKLYLCTDTPIILIPINDVNAKKKVTANELVIVYV